MYYYANVTFDSWETSLCHHGIKGQKWGLRRYQNEDGSLTAAGRQHYGYGENLTKAGIKAYRKEYKKLQKLKDKADTNKQSAAVARYNERAKANAKSGIVKGALTGLTAAGGGKIGVALATKGLSVSGYATTAALGALTALSAGKVAYNKIRANAAKKRLSDAGHAEAVQKYKAQLSKMQQTFGNVPLSALNKKKQ